MGGSAAPGGAPGGPACRMPRGFFPLLPPSPRTDAGCPGIVLGGFWELPSPPLLGSLCAVSESVWGAVWGPFGDRLANCLGSVWGKFGESLGKHLEHFGTD